MKVKFFSSAMTCALFSTLFFYACSKEDITTPQQTVSPKTTTESRLMSVAYYRDSKDGASIQIRFFESQRIYDLPKSTPNFDGIKQLLDNSQDTKIPVRVECNNEQSEFVPMTSAIAATQEEIKNFMLQYHAEDNDSRSLPVIYKEIIPSEAKLTEIFNYMKAQGCTSPDVEIDYCIPFQYVVDGCYARAHKMKQILQDKYGYTCDKAFSYEGPYGYLAVDAGTCCVFWWYHVAPYVKVKTSAGIVQMVMDPSMFDTPVSLATWTGAQENLSCSPDADFGYSDIEPAYWYSPGGGTDYNYYSTNYTLQSYASLVTCP